MLNWVDNYGKGTGMALRMVRKTLASISVLALGCAAVAVPSAQAYEPWTAGEVRTGTPDGAKPHVGVEVRISDVEVKAGQKFEYKVTYQASSEQGLIDGTRAVTFTAQEGTIIDWQNIRVEGASTPQVEVAGNASAGRTGTFNLPVVDTPITLTIPATMPNQAYLDQHPEYVARGRADAIAEGQPQGKMERVDTESYRYPEQVDPCTLRTTHAFRYDGGGYGTWLAELDFGFGQELAGENRTVKEPTFQFYDRNPINPDRSRNTAAKRLTEIEDNVRGYNANFDVPLQVRQSNTSLKQWNADNKVVLDASHGWNFDAKAGVGDTWIPDGTYILAQHTVANTKCESNPAAYEDGNVSIQSRVHIGHHSPVRTAKAMGSDELVRASQPAPQQPRQDPARTGNAWLSGTARYDKDLDGTLSEGDPGVPNLVVLVSHPGELTRMTTTDEKGNWRVDGLSPYANYQVRYVVPDGWFASSKVDSATDEAGLTARVTATPEGTTGNLDVGLVSAGEISERVGATGGNVWAPSADGKRVGIPGVTVKVIAFEGLGEEDRVTTTDANGAWYVTGLTPGVDYRVEFELPDGYYATSLPQGATLDDGKVSRTVPIRNEAPAVLDGDLGVVQPGGVNQGGGDGADASASSQSSGSSDKARGDVGRCWENAKRSPFFYLLPVGLLGVVAAPFAQPYIDGALAQLAATNPQAHRALTDPNTQMAAGAVTAVAALGIAGGLLYDWCSNEPGEAVTASSVR